MCFVPVCSAWLARLPRNEWECPELVSRYLALAYGLPPIRGDGDQIVAHAAAYLHAHPDLAIELKLVGQVRRTMPLGRRSSIRFVTRTHCRD
jgi:hypothetical protein